MKILPPKTTRAILLATFGLLAPAVAHAQQHPAPAPSTTTPAPTAQPAEPAPSSTTPAPPETAPPPSAPPPSTTPPPTPTPTPTPTQTPSPPTQGESHVKPAPPRPPPVRKVTVPVIVSGIIGAAGLASGVIFTVSAASQYSAYKNSDHRDVKADHDVALAGERAMFIADVSFAIAALFGLTSLGLYLLPDEEEPAKSALSRPVLRF